MDKTDKICAGLIFLFCFLAISIFTTKGVYTTREFFDIYKATVPFGEFVISGSLEGAMFLFIGNVEGEISGEEYYLIKYFVNGEVRTMKLNADEVPLVIDGNFQLEVISQYLTIRPFYLYEHIRRSNPSLTYKIHIPYLPEVNQTLTDNWRAHPEETK